MFRILLLLLLTTTCFGLDINLKLGGGLGFLGEWGEYDRYRDEVVDQPGAPILMFKAGIAFSPNPLWSIQPEVRLISKMAGESEALATTTTLWGGDISFFDFYTGYYYGTTKYGWIISPGSNTEEDTHMFLVGYRYQGFFVELMYQHGEGVERIITGEEYDHGAGNVESFSVVFGYNFSISIL